MWVQSSFRCKRIFVPFFNNYLYHYSQISFHHFWKWDYLHPLYQSTCIILYFWIGILFLLSYFYFKFLYSGFARPGKTIVAYTFQFITVLCSFITMWVSSSPSVSFFRYFGFPCVYLFFAVVGLRRRNRFQFKVIMTPEQLSMNCNCHLATYRCFVCCSFIFYCCVVIFIQWYYSNENLFLLLHHGY